MTVESEVITAPKPSLLIAVCTRQRNDLLKRLIKSIWTQPRPDLFLSIDVLIVDNNDVPSVAVSDFDLSDTFGLIVKHQPKQGLVNARNMVLDTAEALDATWLFCVDDDEWVADEWLGKFAEGIQKFQADILIGRTHVIHDEAQLIVPPKNKSKAVPGARTTTFSGSNMAVRNTVFHKNKGAGLRFDIRFNESGSEDTELLFRAMRAHGLTAVNFPAAEVYEEWFGSRGTLLYRLKRRAKFQHNSFRIASMHRKAGYLEGAKPLWRVILRYTNKNFIFGGGNILKGCLIVAFNRRKGLGFIGAGLESWARIAAIAPFILGKEPTTYGKDATEQR